MTAVRQVLDSSLLGGLPISLPDSFANRLVEIVILPVEERGDSGKDSLLLNCFCSSVKLSYLFA